MAGSSIWDYTADSMWIPDAYLSTGTSGYVPGVPRCGGAQPGFNRPAYGPYPAKVTVDGRRNTDPSNVNQVDAYVAGEDVYLRCQDTGTPVNGNDVWGYTMEGYWIPDTYLSTGVNGFAPGVPTCSDVGVSGGGVIAGGTAPGARYFLAKTTLNAYSSKSLSSSKTVDKYAGGSMVGVVCQAYGEMNYGGSTVWAKTVHGLWVADYYLKTGSSDIVMGRCDGDSADTSINYGVPKSEVRAKIVTAARSKLGLAEWGDNCNPFGLNGTKCGDPWCSMFASWTWRQAGIDVYYPWTGSFYYWGQQHGLLRSRGDINPGDLVLYGSGTNDSKHVGVVETVLDDGRIVTIEGNYSNAVRRVGPFDPYSPSPIHAHNNIYGVVSPVNDTEDRLGQGDPYGPGTTETQLPLGGLSDAEIVALAADLAGIFDPTPISDGISGIIAVGKGDWAGAGLSVAAMIPYAGDALSKPAKILKALAKFQFVARLNVDDVLRALKHIDWKDPEKLNDALSSINRLGSDAAKAYTNTKWKAKADALGLPTNGPVPFVPPKGWDPKRPKTGQMYGRTGFVDINGNIWYKSKQAVGNANYEWDVQVPGKVGIGQLSKDGKHINIEFGTGHGRITH